MDTVKPMFYEIMVSSVSASFSDLVSVGIKVELRMKNGKMITAAETSNNNARKNSGGFQKKKEGETNVVSVKEVIHGRSSINSSLINNPLIICSLVNNPM